MITELDPTYFEQWSIPEPNTGCWLWLRYVDEYGYGRMRVPRRPSAKAHRVSFELHTGISADRMNVLHRCDTPICVNPAHLFLGTTEDNMKDMAKKGRWRPHGLNILQMGRHKLLKEQVIEIFLSSEKQKSLADKFGVSISSISNIRRGDKWSFLTAALSQAAPGGDS